MFRNSIYILIQYSKDNLEKLFCQYYSKNCHYFAPEIQCFDAVILIANESFENFEILKFI